jgi:hypothetical protein
MKVARQFTASNMLEKGVLSRRDDLIYILAMRGFKTKDAVDQSNHTVPLGRAAFFIPIPDSKLPGYLHLVPTGQRLSRELIPTGFVPG